MRNDKEISFGWSFCFAKNKNAAQDTPVRPENSEITPFAIDFHA
jgi:hypothetical protein